MTPMRLPSTKFMIWLTVVVGFAGLCLAYSYFVEPHRLVVNEQTIYIKKWNPAFEGLRIAVLGDIHGGSNGVTESKLREVVAKTNEQNADMIVLLGDYASQRYGGGPVGGREIKMPISTIADNLTGLRAPLGVFIVLGNHDGWYGDESVIGEFSRVGYRVMQNEVAIVERDGQRLRIFGMKDHLALKGGWYRTAAESKEIVSTTGPGDLIVLQHSPDIHPMLTGQFLISPDLRLILAAHTHGGQVRLPILGAPIVPSGYGQKYVRGHVVDKGIDMFVTTGIGTSILPFRFMVPPEIAVLTIRAEPQA